MSETRKLAAILCSDVVGYSRLAGADEDRILARLRVFRRAILALTHFWWRRASACANDASLQ
jgi:class 3 adenylate cyclase